MTREQLLEMYQRYPASLEEEVARVLRPLATDKERIEHNSALSRFITLFPTGDAEEALWRNVAQAIIKTGVEHGKT